MQRMKHKHAATCVSQGIVTAKTHQMCLAVPCSPDEILKSSTLVQRVADLGEDCRMRGNVVFSFDSGRAVLWLYVIMTLTIPEGSELIDAEVIEAKAGRVEFQEWTRQEHRVVGGHGGRLLCMCVEACVCVRV